MQLRSAALHADGVTPASGCALTSVCRRRRAVGLGVGRWALPAAPDTARYADYVAR
jgi:hypothetical protein